jgi:ABC-type Zn uptake system ZnuABC Zn-binding protein ZnuA
MKSQITKSSSLLFITFLMIFVITGCTSPRVPSPGKKKVIAAESFLAEMTKNIAGERVAIDTLVPPELDPHTFEPTSKDAARLQGSDLVIINGNGLEAWIEPLIINVISRDKILEASASLQPRDHDEDAKESGSQHTHEIDPHFWLDPNLVLVYLEKIYQGLVSIDKEGESVYQNNKNAYRQLIIQLDEWIVNKVKEIPEERRLLVTNHESLGYFADRYGFTIVGTIIPSVSTGAAPSSQQMAMLIEKIKAMKIPAIFLETGANPQLASQIERETGVKVVLNLNTHSVIPGKAGQSTYIELMKSMVDTIVQSLQ